MDSFVLVAYESVAASRTFLQQSLACLNFPLNSEDSFYICKQKKWFLWTMVAAKPSENYEDEWGLTWHLSKDIYASVPSWTHSQNSLAAESPNVKVSSHGTSLEWTQSPS